MITIYYEKHWNDLVCQEYSEEFHTLTGLENWIFEMMRQDYKGDSLTMHFPQGKEPSKISFCPEYGGPNIWIHLVKEGSSIVFSDGRHTSGIKHASKTVQGWLAHCEERRRDPIFNFAE